MIESAVKWLLQVLAVPEVGLGSVFIVSFLSATLLPLGSEPAVFAVVKANSALLWPTVVLATLGNTLGGVVDYWMGRQAQRILTDGEHGRALRWLQAAGPKTMLLSWLPLVGDPLCTLAGWLRLPFWPSVLYMAVGKCIRYLVLTGLLLKVPDGFWRSLGEWLF